MSTFVKLFVLSLICVSCANVPTKKVTNNQKIETAQRSERGYVYNRFY